jgi:hypothetical membrane protein
MSRPARFCLLFGILAGLGFIATWLVLGALLPNYDPITQTISEIGEKGSPFEMPYKIAMLIVAGSFVLFSCGVYRFSAARRLSVAPALLLGFFALTQLGVSTFESPNPLHNLFGIASIPAFLTPLVLAITWRAAPGLQGLRKLSWVAGVIVLIAIAVNLSPLFIRVPYIAGHIGLMQRFLPLFHLWCARLAIILLRNTREPADGIVARA